MKRFTPFFQPEMFAYWLLPLAYAWAYAPFGLNTTDGGFLTGLAWQILSGERLYADAVYVRPPIPVWLRSLEMTILPDQWAILGERWVFFFKVAFYNLLIVKVLWPHSTRWVFAVAAYIVSVHTYPPMAWHTIDGLMFGAMGLYFSFNANHYRSWWAAGCCIALAMLCKQSFYPLIGVVFLAAWKEKAGLGKAAWMTAGGAIVWLLVASFWIIDGIWSDYWTLTTGATTLRQALRHGVADYFQIPSILVVFTVICAAGLSLWPKLAPRFGRLADAFWWLWVAGLVFSFAWTVHQRQAYTVPFAQSRILFIWAALYAVLMWRSNIPLARRLTAALLLAWCASISWGFATPILFAAPLLAWPALISNQMAGKMTDHPERWGWGFVIVLLGVMFYARQFEYRDGRHADMDAFPGEIFPALQGIRTTPERFAQLKELSYFIKKYGGNYAVLPAFTQAHFLSGHRPAIPIDWVVLREAGETGRIKVMQAFESYRPVVLIEKNCDQGQMNDPEWIMIRDMVAKTRRSETGDYYEVRVWVE